MTLDLNAIRERAERHAKAMGTGGERAWVAGLLAADVPALLAEIDRQDKAIQLNHDGEKYAEELLAKQRAALAAAEQDRDKLSDELARATIELELKTKALQRVRYLASPLRHAHSTFTEIARIVEPALRLEVWDGSVPPGGYVCAICRVPVESEPCAEHSGTEGGQ